MNTGTEGGGGNSTRVGDDGLFMAGAHVAHVRAGGRPGDHGEQLALAGHLRGRRRVIIGGPSPASTQWVRIARARSFGAVTMVTNDVIPYVSRQGPRGGLDGLNLVGVKRRGVAREDIMALRAAFQGAGAGRGRLSGPARAA